MEYIHKNNSILRTGILRNNGLNYYPSTRLIAFTTNIKSWKKLELEILLLSIVVLPKLKELVKNKE